jgi:hypothetical protein
VVLTNAAGSLEPSMPPGGHALPLQVLGVVLAAVGLLALLLPCLASGSMKLQPAGRGCPLGAAMSTPCPAAQCPFSPPPSLPSRWMAWRAR